MQGNQISEGTLPATDQLISSLPPAEGIGTMLGAVAAARAYLANMRGETHQAVKFARQALGHLPVSNDFSCSLRGAATSMTLQMATLPDGQISPLAERDCAGLSRVYYEWIQLEAAREYAQQCRELSRR